MEEAQEKKSYELAFLINKEDFVRELERILKQHNMDIGSAAQSRKISLAYDINKFNQAYFISFQTESPPADVKALERDLKTFPEILRFMVMRLPKQAARPVYSREDSSARRPKIFIKRDAPTHELPGRQEVLSNEDLEKKIEEILQ